MPAFKPPEAKNARIVLAWLGVILISPFVGITFLTRPYHLTPLSEQTILSQLSRQIFGDGMLYYAIQASTMLILVLAANTAFADFPRLNEDGKRKILGLNAAKLYDVEVPAELRGGVPAEEPATEESAVGVG